ncbi:enoyl-CoA hydratase/isomerase family protein [Caballeronia ptereochthonis]|uniref:3-hydroxyisobutyryl-CoA hydrolase n=1 Tax=Caballeronia ptereochthonis TaxID=1777144 RepID=A0A158AUC2_9BURK|nr:enoyl-CoA hydratase/isomerase family protein [Caballeronia ptereochthonis]SAK61454.1 enoyl-CoA hydratase/isomerase [Caballeronia ptereochthonis]
MSTPGLLRDTPEVGFEVVNRVAIVTLDRPHALNALSHDMIALLSEILAQCAEDDAIVAVVLRGAGDKAFCAGGDVRKLYHAARNDPRHETPWLKFFIDEYRLDYTVHRFRKPVIALMDGIVMGGGMGLAQGAALRIATERTRMAMPETRIGLLPDVGATHFLRVLPRDLALYVGLTGARLTGADARRVGLADECVPSSWLSGFVERLEKVRWDDSQDAMTPLKRVFVPSANIERHAPLDDLRAQIRRHFSVCATGGVERIVASLAADTDNDWSRATLATLKGHSPTMLEVTCHALMRGRQMPLADCFRMELGIVYRAIDDGDFVEGVRALIIDKDEQPRFAPTTLAQVRAERVQHFLSSPWRREMHPLADLGA